MQISKKYPARGATIFMQFLLKIPNKPACGAAKYLNFYVCPSALNNISSGKSWSKLLKFEYYIDLLHSSIPFDNVILTNKLKLRNIAWDVLLNVFGET